MERILNEGCMKHIFHDLDYIEIYHKSCNEKMIPESVFNGNDGFFKCQLCGLRVHVYVHSKKEDKKGEV